MNRLQRLRRAGRLHRHAERDGPGRRAAVLDRMDYAHPVYTPESVAAQRRLPALDDRRAPRSRRLPRLGLPRGRLPVRRRAAAPPRCGGDGGRAPCRRSRVPAIVDCTVAPRPACTPVRQRLPLPRLHVAGRPRPAAAAAALAAAARPLRRPRPPRRPATRTHPGQRRRLPGRATASTSTGGRVHDAGQRPRARLRVQPAHACTGATRPTASSLRRGRGAQHLRRAALPTCCGPTPAGRAEADKEFYVSPFFPVDGRYRMRCPEPGDRG